MKNMVSGRKSDRNRKNIVFGKIPQKMLVVEKKIGHRKIFDGRNFFDRHLENFSSPNKIFFDRKFFQRRKKISTDFFDNHFSLSKNKFQTTFFLTSFLLAKSLLPPPPPPHTHIHHMTASRGWPHGGCVTEKNVSVTLGYELDDR